MSPRGLRHPRDVPSVDRSTLGRKTLYVTRLPQVLFQYEPGSVPIIISAPHGGTEEPDEIADRIAGCPTSNGCVYEKDEVS